MPAIIYRRLEEGDLDAVLILQEQNLVWNLKNHANGFLSTQFSAADFRAMNEELCVMVALDGQHVCAYLCASLPEFHQSPLWRILRESYAGRIYDSKSLGSYRVCFGSPMCIDEVYRGCGIFEGLCYFMIEQYLKPYYEVILSFLPEQNLRCWGASQRIGFKKQFIFEMGGKNYQVMLLDLRDYKEHGAFRGRVAQKSRSSDYNPILKAF